MLFEAMRNISPSGNAMVKKRQRREPGNQSQARKKLYTLGLPNYSFVDVERSSTDFTRYADQHFSHNIRHLVNRNKTLKPLAFQDRYGRLRAGRTQNRRVLHGFLSKLRPFRGEIYVGYRRREHAAL